MATFAIRGLGTGETRGKFVARMPDRRLGHTRRAAVDAFGRARRHRDALGNSPQ